MADTQASSFTALTGANLASGDKWPVIDVSEAGAAKNKNMTTTELVAGLNLQNGVIFKQATTGARTYYTTLADAKTGASSGETVFVGPGTYAVTASILKNGVNWHFAPGATVTMDASSNATLLGPLGDGTGITCEISGSGSFTVDASGRVGTAEVTTFNCTNGASMVGGEYVSLYGTSNARFNFWFLIDGSGSAPGAGGTDVQVSLSAGFSVADLTLALSNAITGAIGSGGWASAVDSSPNVVVTDGTQESRTTASSSTGLITATETTPGVDYVPMSALKTIASSNIKVTAKMLKLITNAAVSTGRYDGVVHMVDGDLDLKCDTIWGSGNSNSGIWWQDGVGYVTASTITAGYYGIYSDVGSSSSDNLYVNAEFITCTNAGGEAHGCVSSFGTSANAGVWVFAKVIRATTSAAFAIQGSGSNKIYVTSQKLYGIIIGGNGQLYIRTDKLSPVGNNSGVLSLNASSPFFIKISHLDIGSTTGTNLGTAGSSVNCDLEIGSYTSDSAGSGLTVTGSVRLINSKLDLTAGTNKTAVTVSSGSPTIQNCVLIGTGTGKDINVTGGSCKVVNCTGSGTSGLIRRNGAANFVSGHTKLKDFTSTVGNVGAGEDDLLTFTTGVDTLGNTGDVLKAEYHIVTAAHASDTRRVKVYFAGTVIYDTTAVATVAAATAKIDVLIIRTGSTTARAVVSFHCNHATMVSGVTETDLTSLTFTNTNIIKITGEAVSDNDITAKLGTISFEPAAS